MPMPNSRNVAPMTTWHSQASFLWIAWTWGLSYCFPPHDRVPFAEVFPDDLARAHLPMWGWGSLLVIGATIALVSEITLRYTRYRPWGWAHGGHMLLAGTYITLALAAALQSFSEFTWGGPVHDAGDVISAVSRTVLWGVIGLVHTTYARMPRVPDIPAVQEEPARE